MTTYTISGASGVEAEANCPASARLAAREFVLTDGEESATITRDSDGAWKGIGALDEHGNYVLRVNAGWAL